MQSFEAAFLVVETFQKVDHAIVFWCLGFTVGLVPVILAGSDARVDNVLEDIGGALEAGWLVIEGEDIFCVYVACYCHLGVGRRSGSWHVVTG